MNILPPRQRTATAPTPVSVNGVMISAREITREIQYHPTATPDESWRKAAEALVLRALLLEEVKKNGIAAEPVTDDKGRRETEEEAQIRCLIEQAVQTPTPTEEELRRYYQANREKFRSQELIEARHILIAASEDDVPAYEAARARAAALAEELAAEPDRFEMLARAHSDCASAAEGGVLGQLAPEETTSEFAAAVATLDERETSREPVAARYGFHLIRLDRRIPARIMPFDSVRARIADYLNERSHRMAMAQYLARLISRARITGIAIAGADTLRVH